MNPLLRGLRYLKREKRLPSVLTDVQRLVFDHPMNVRLRVTGGLAVEDGCVALVHSGVLRLQLKADVH